IHTNRRSIHLDFPPRRFRLTFSNSILALRCRVASPPGGWGKSLCSPTPSETALHPPALFEAGVSLRFFPEQRRKIPLEQLFNCLFPQLNPDFVMRRPQVAIN
ncbi:MAG: hypothetical protein L6Q69_17130, partial [Zoogloea sp.]|nr:hypothetical protein [Zoogloea sp.]